MQPIINGVDAKKVLALWVPVTFVIHVALWMFVSPYLPPVPDKVFGMLQTLLGAHMAWAGMIINYFFSSSASSARKDEIIAASAPPPRAPEAP